ncbi:MAG: tetratricopeptide repeat protein [candidate division Zixibacteria bacterium]
MKNCKEIIIILMVFALFLPTVICAQEADKISAAPIIEETLKDFGIDAAIVKFREIRAQEESYSVLQAELLRLGGNLRREGKIQEAIAVFNMTIEAFPNSDQAYFGLGRAYRSLGLNDKDLESTNRAYDIRNAGRLADFILKNKISIAKNAEQVIDRYLQAIGGKENLVKIKTIKLTLTGLNAVNQEAAFFRYYKYPHFCRQTVVRSGNSNVTDGKKVWRVTSEGWKENPQSNFKYFPDIYGDFIDYKERGISYKLLGIEAIDSRVMYRLLKTHKDGHTREYYFSAESGLFVMERRDFGIGKDIKRHYDWREVEGILFPHMFVVTSKVGLGNSHGAIIKEIKINETLDDSLFIEL